MHGVGIEIDLAEKLAMFNEHWSPKLIAELNDHNVMVVKMKGEFPWHTHEDEDELFVTIEGEFIVRFRDRELRLRPGQAAVVPRGVEHQTAAEVETSIIYIARSDARHAGDIDYEHAVDQPEPI